MAARNWRGIRDAQRQWNNRPFDAESVENVETTPNNQGLNTGGEPTTTPNQGTPDNPVPNNPFGDALIKRGYSPELTLDDLRNFVATGRTSPSAR